MEGIRLAESRDDEASILNVFGRDFARSRNRSRLLDAALAYWRRRGFPYPSLQSDEQELEFHRLQRMQAREVIRGRDIHASTLGLRLANFFHPQIWHVPARRHRRSPIEHFGNDATLIKLLNRAVRFWPNRRCWNAQCLRSLLRIYAGGRVSNFRPAASKALIQRYSKGGDTVLDFSAGFGGRLLGCLSLERRYIAIDPAQNQILGLERMVEALRPLTSTCVEVIQGCAEDVMPRLTAASVNLVFSSPPYFNVERYSADGNQSYRRYPTYTAWIEQFLTPVFTNSERVLAPGGYLVVNIADTQRHAIEHDIKGLLDKLFGARRVLRLLMHARPLQRSVGSAVYRWEPVLVFRKHYRFG